jgi:hypothetical protein
MSQPAAKPSPTIYSEVPEDELSSPDIPALDPGADDDFQLSIPLSRPAVIQPTGEAYKLAEEPAAPAVAEATPPAEAPEKPAEAAAAEAKPARPKIEESAVAHSVATGGDALLDIAMQEQKEVQKRQKTRKLVGGMKTPGGGLIIFCPYGCRVEVKESHRGMQGKCPRCGAPFIVPTNPPQYKTAAKEEAVSAAAAPGKEKFRFWLPDVHLHVVAPEKLKLKADSLLKEFVEADLGCSPEHLIVAVLMGKKGGGGMFGKKGPPLKKEDVRAAMIAHLNEDKPLADLQVGEKYVFTTQDLSQLKVVQPTANRGDSIFHGIPIFGTGKIAIQLPLTDQAQQPTYISMGITQFWKLAKAFEEVYQIVGLGRDSGLPTEPKFSMSKCHYTDTPIRAVENVDLYKADPSVQLEVAGYRCGACKIVVSEAGRKKENLGGKSPKGIAKAKCPKCSNKMGENLLYSLKEDVAEPSLAGESK